MALTLRELSLLQDRDSYTDYTLSEYEVLGKFFRDARPRDITIIGGGDNLDLFYASQGVSEGMSVTNWDPGDANPTRMHHHHGHYQEITGFKGDYQHIAMAVTQVPQHGSDLLWFGAHDSGIHEITQWPEHIIFNHYGHLHKSEHLLHIRRHRPLVALGRRLAIFSGLGFDPTTCVCNSEKITWFDQPTWRIGR